MVNLNSDLIGFPIVITCRLGDDDAYEMSMEYLGEYLMGDVRLWADDKEISKVCCYYGKTYPQITQKQVTYNLSKILTTALQSVTQTNFDGWVVNFDKHNVSKINTLMDNLIKMDDGLLRFNFAYSQIGTYLDAFDCRYIGGIIFEPLMCPMTYVYTIDEQVNPNGNYCEEWFSVIKSFQRQLETNSTSSNQVIKIIKKNISMIKHHLQNPHLNNVVNQWPTNANDWMDDYYFKNGCQFAKSVVCAKLMISILKEYE